MFDVRCHDFARIWLQAGGWTHDMDVNRLAQLVSDLAEDFTADLAQQYEQEARHGRP